MTVTGKIIVINEYREVAFLHSLCRRSYSCKVKIQFNTVRQLRQKKGNKKKYQKKKEQDRTEKNRFKNLFVPETE